MLFFFKLWQDHARGAVIGGLSIYMPRQSWIFDVGFLLKEALPELKLNKIQFR
jgi:hypothetical protein